MTYFAVCRLRWFVERVGVDSDGGVFTPDLIASWVTWKKEKELDEMHLRPHPHEFHLYYDS